MEGNFDIVQLFTNKPCDADDNHPKVLNLKGDMLFSKDETIELTFNALGKNIENIINKIDLNVDVIKFDIDIIQN